MSQSTVSEAGMTCLNPHAHHISVTQSQHWDWITVPSSAPPPVSPPSRRGGMRQSMLACHASHGHHVSRTCRHFGIARPTFYRWQARYQQSGVSGLEDRSHRPERVRQRSWSSQVMDAVLRLRQQYPHWGKAKLQILLAREGMVVSTSMVCRILTELKACHRLHEPPSRRKRYGTRPPRPYATRKPKEYAVTAPGDLVQVDTLDVRPVADKTFKHLSLVDVTSRYAAAEIGTSATAAHMTGHLDRILGRLPFGVRAIQVDGGSEFKADFEAYCAQHGVRLFELPPRSPKLNGCVERLQRTFGEECYQCCDVPPRVPELATALRSYEELYNHVRPHQALGYRTPAQYLADWEASACVV